MTKPSQNAAKLYAKAKGCVRLDQKADKVHKLQKGWGFRVSAWNVDSLTDRAGEVVDALVDREVGVACIKEKWLQVL